MDRDFEPSWVKTTKAVIGNFQNTLSEAVQELETQCSHEKHTSLELFGLGLKQGVRLQKSI